MPLPSPHHCPAADQVPAYQSTASNTLLAWADQLPFKSNTIDYIISLQNLEHLHDPVQAVLHYLVRGAGGRWWPLVGGGAAMYGGMRWRMLGPPSCLLGTALSRRGIQPRLPS